MVAGFCCLFGPVGAALLLFLLALALLLLSSSSDEESESLLSLLLLLSLELTTAVFLPVLTKAAVATILAVLL